MKDVNGADVYSEGFKDVKEKITVELPVLSNGLYFINVQNKKTNWMKKYIIIQ